MDRRSFSTLKSILLLAGSFTFAFLLGEAVHEYGHYLANLNYGLQGVQIHLDPFGSSQIVGVPTPQNPVMGGVTGAAGPLFNLALGMGCFLLLWRFRRPRLLPLLMWGPVAMVQEGVTFSLGLLTPGGDAQWVAGMGIPAMIILILGILLLLAGVIMIAGLITLPGIRSEDSFGRKYFILLLGMGSLMLIRFIHSLAAAPQSINENMIPLVFTLLLSALVASLHAPMAGIMDQAFLKEPAPISWSSAASGLILGTGMFLFQVIALN